MRFPVYQRAKFVSSNDVDNKLKHSIVWSNKLEEFVVVSYVNDKDSVEVLSLKDGKIYFANPNDESDLLFLRPPLGWCFNFDNDYGYYVKYSGYRSYKYGIHYNNIWSTVDNPYSTSRSSSNVAFNNMLLDVYPSFKEAFEYSADLSQRDRDTSILYDNPINVVPFCKHMGVAFENDRFAVYFGVNRVGNFTVRNGICNVDWRVKGSQRLFISKMFEKYTNGA